jgi:class 3 adenylate cyclase
VPSYSAAKGGVAQLTKSMAIELAPSNNLAARVQGLAAENEIYLSDEMYRLPGAADLLATTRCDAQTVHVKGVEREIAVHALRARP